MCLVGTHSLTHTFTGQRRTVAYNLRACARQRGSRQPGLGVGGEGRSHLGLAEELQLPGLEALRFPRAARAS